MRRVRMLLLTVVAACGMACGSESGVSAPDGSPAPRAPVAAAPPPVTSGEAPPSAPPPPPAPKLGAPYPIVLVHGMAGFATLEIGPVAIDYFAGVASDLTQRGEQVFVTVAPPYDTSEERAKAIAKQLDAILERTGKAKVNLVGHSQGGLDARVIASPQGLGYGDRVASVTTVATPHRGSKIADAVLGLTSGLPSAIVDKVTTDFLKLTQSSSAQLKSDPHLRAQIGEISELHMVSSFNPKFVDDARVKYASYAGRTNLAPGFGACDGAKFPNNPLALDVAQPPLGGLAVFLEEGKGRINDGLVTVESSKWGDFMQCVAADHYKEVGQLGPLAASFDHLAFYRALVERIRKAGL